MRNRLSPEALVRLESEAARIDSLSQEEFERQFRRMVDENPTLAWIVATVADWLTPDDDSDPD